MMTSAQTLQRARVLAVLAGAMDFGTGLGMVFLPSFTLKLMMVPVPEGDGLLYARFVGAFVGAVGFSYLWALLSGVGAERGRALRAVLRFTIPFRVAAGSFCLAAVIGGALAPMWLSVTLADYGLVALQTWLLRGSWEEGAV
ncbi:hypothetical protein [Actomonas aquatica]|uniref:Uncharacterized protein n=1 Tax=Actomonas aquatica TaxID=2866162 RepID=A0ABZ1C451_9BACT|nr:hypothetical protein [Opitutus sp. WL0086]WRQ86474.1 hypothetical protein K1X11_016785 [Opitutus sp. WL0086]